MKRKKRILGVLMIIAALIIMQLPVSEADAAASASDFVIEGGTLVKYRGKDKNVSIPDTVDVVGEGAFEGNTNIELVVIPKSVKRIDPYAFWWCDNLDTVVLGSGLSEVGDYAFSGCTGLRQMTIPKNISYIGINAFTDCVNLKDISIPPETIKIHETAFGNCYQLKIHCEPGTVADQYAQWFYERQKEMPEYQDAAGYDPSKPSASTPRPLPAQTPEPPSGGTIGSSWIVGDSAFIFADNTQFRVYDGGPQTGTDRLPLADLMGDFSDGLAKYTVVDGRVIADQAYYRSSQFRALKLPEGIGEIGQFSFARSSLSKITVPEGTTDICYGAFYHCDYLADVKLPETIVNVEPKAFGYTAWVENFLKGGESANGDFLIEGGVLVAYRGNGSQVTVPDGVRVIAGEAFQGHEEIRALSLPDSLRVVGEAAFENCSSLADISLGEGVEEIKDRAFFGTGISGKKISLPASVKRLGLYAFEGAEVVCVGRQPEQIHEPSAERLSNVSYRIYPEQKAQEKGVTVRGMEGASASLEGAGDSYTLTISRPQDISAMNQACVRAFGTEMPESMHVYDLTLTDSSGIPLTKLGTQELTVVLPVPEALKGQELKLLTLDRNGQAEAVALERVTAGGAEAVRFKVKHLSLFGIYGAGQASGVEELMEINVEVSSLSEGPGQAVSEKILPSGPRPGLWAGLGLLLAGLALIFAGGKGRQKQTE